MHFLSSKPGYSTICHPDLHYLALWRVPKHLGTFGPYVNNRLQPPTPGQELDQRQILSQDPHNWQSPHLATGQQLGIAQSIAHFLVSVTFPPALRALPSARAAPCDSLWLTLQYCPELDFGVSSKCHSIDRSRTKIIQLSTQKVKVYCMESLCITLKIWALHLERFIFNKIRLLMSPEVFTRRCL